MTRDPGRNPDRPDRARPAGPGARTRSEPRTATGSKRRCERLAARPRLVGSSTSAAGQLRTSSSEPRPAGRSRCTHTITTRAGSATRRIAQRTDRRRAPIPAAVTSIRRDDAGRSRAGSCTRAAARSSTRRSAEPTHRPAGRAIRPVAAELAALGVTGCHDPGELNCRCRDHSAVRSSTAPLAEARQAAAARAWRSPSARSSTRAIELGLRERRRRRRPLHDGLAEAVRGRIARLAQRGAARAVHRRGHQSADRRAVRAWS